VSEARLYRSQLTIVAQEGDDKVVRQRHEVHRVAEQVRDPVVLRNQWHEQKLQDVEEGPDRKVGPDGNLDCSRQSL